jgi:mRNA-degrading endonuclease RelE of RelBE toxin-antitoxin system
MVFIETPVFTREPQKFLPDGHLRRLQAVIMLRPESGDLIKESGGLRKIRWSLPGSGKRGGIRVIYYFDPPDTVYLIFPYRKSKKEDLTKNQIKILSQLVEEYLK